MTQPLFFDPDPSIPDSDLLGYGNLIFDNGQSQWVNGDEDATQFPRPPEQPVDLGPPVGGWSGHDFSGPQASVDPLTSPEPDPVPMFAPEEPPAFPGAMASGPMETGSMGGMPPDGGLPPIRIEGTDHALDSTGKIVPAQDVEQPAGQSAAGLPPVPIPGTDHALDSTGKIVPASSLGGNGFGSGGLQLAQREGALPPDVAAQQAQDRAIGNSAELAAVDQSRQAQFKVYNDAALQRMGQLDAEKQAHLNDIQEQKDKQARLQKEQQLVASMDIKTDLVSAEGGVGAVLSILGAALLGFVHSDAGLRMIDSTIDQNVRRQIGMRDSKLKILADQVGSTEQVIATAKSELYKNAAERAEAMIEKTKADAFQAQSPEIIAGLRQKQQQYDQERVAISLGKTLEKAPVAPPQPKPADVQKYGKAAADQEQSENNILRAARELGLTGWDPKTKTFKNREEVLKDGIAGVGAEDTFARDVGKVPILGEIPKALDNLATSKKGMAVRAALESLVAAEAAAQNPGRAPTDADRDAARLSLGLTTEEGTVRAIERLYGQQEQAKAQNRATYGEGAAGKYEGAMDASGTRRPAANGAVDVGTPLEPGKARQMLEQERARKPAAAAGPQASAEPIIKKEEGFRSTAYQDSAGNWTIGFGHTGPEVVEGMKVTRAEAQQLLAQDMDTAERAVVDSIDVPLDDGQKQALVSLAYNIGGKAFADSTLVQKINAGDFEGAAAEFDRWNKITLNGAKKVSAGLAKRRDREESLFRGEG